MQKFLTLLYLVIFSISSIHAQIVETEKAMNAGVNTALLLTIPDADTKIVEKVWKTYAKSFKGKVKKVKKTDEFLTESPLLAGFNSSGLKNIVVLCEQRGDEVEFYSWFELRDQYLSSYHFPEEFDEAQKVILNFGLEVAKEYTRMELEGEEKTMKKMKNDLKKMVRDKENYEKSIEDYKQKIIEAEAAIENNIIEQARMQENIDAQHENIELVKNKLANLNN